VSGSVGPTKHHDVAAYTLCIAAVAAVAAFEFGLRWIDTYIGVSRNYDNYNCM
jgi:hypothetical protein